MASLTTVYVISVILTSIAGMGAAFVGSKIYPLKGGAEPPPPTPAEVKRATADAADKAARLAAAEVYQIKAAEKAEQEGPTGPAEVPEVPEVPTGPVEVPEVPEVPTGPVEVPEVPEVPTGPVEVPVSPTGPSEELVIAEVPTGTTGPRTLEQVIKDEFKMDDEFANNVMDFIKTPVMDWKKIATSPQVLRSKFRRTLSHPNLQKCPKELLDVCKIVNIKYSNMKDFIDGKSFVPYGDQTPEASTLLTNIA
jgi:hypothetical protein